MSKRRVLVAGATGRLGRAVVQAAAQRGYWVRALGRNPERLSTVIAADEQAPVDLVRGEPSLIHDAARDVHAVISCMGASILPELGRGRQSFSKVDAVGNTRLIEAAEQQGAERFVYVAVAGHDALGHLGYVAAHERVVARLSEARLATSVLRATGFFSAFDSIFDLARRGKVPLIGDPEARTNPIADDDLAELCVTALDEAPVQRSVGGPEIMTRRHVAELAFEALGTEPRFVLPPDFVVRTMASLVWPISPRVSDLMRFFLAVSSGDCIAERAGERHLSEYFAKLASALLQKNDVPRDAHQVTQSQQR